MSATPSGIHASRRVAMALLVAAVAALASAGPTEAARSKSARPAGDEALRFHWSGALREGRRLEVRGINGAIHAVPAAGAEAVVRAEKRGRRSDPSEVEIRVHENDAGVVVCAHYPRPDGSMNEECRDQRVQHNDVRVEFRVEVPAGVEVVAVTVNGDVEATGLGGNVAAAAVNGNVRVSTRGAAAGTTVNGNLDVALGRLPERGPIEFRTVNGSITLTLPAGANADLRATTTHGHVECGLELGGATRQSKRELRGTLGRGGPSLILETVNGSIRIVAG